MSLNQFKSIKSVSPVTFKCMYNAVSLSSFTFYLKCRFDVASVVSGFTNDVSSTLLVFWCILIIKIFILTNYWDSFFIKESTIIHLISTFFVLFFISAIVEKGKNKICKTVYQKAV